MFTSSEIPVIGIILLIALGILGWGFYRARPFGKLGILAWLQSVVLITPWLLFFGLFAAGIYINIAGILILVLTSAALYVFLGRQLRAAGQDAIIKQKATERLAADSSPAADNTPQVVLAELKVEALPIPEEDLSAIKSIFGIDTFFTTETISYQEGAIFKGNMRGEPEEIHNRLTASLQAKLGDKYRLFLVDSTEGKPVVIVLPSRNDPRPMSLQQKSFAVILLIATIATCLETAGLLLNFEIGRASCRERV